MQLNKHNVAEKDTKALIDIVNNVFSVNILKRNRQLKYVDARLVYSKILRDYGYTLKSIAESIGKDHTTIIHYMNQVDHMLRHDSQLMEKYLICKDSFVKDRDHILQKYSELELQIEIINLKNQIDELTLERSYVIRMDEKYKRLKNIIEVIDKRTPDGDEAFIERQINQMFNGITEQFRTKESRENFA